MNYELKDALKLDYVERRVERLENKKRKRYWPALLLWAGTAALYHAMQATDALWQTAIALVALAIFWAAVNEMKD